MAALLHWTWDVELSRLLERSRAFEERAAALYHRFARSETKPESRGLWTRLAAEEEAHARAVAAAAGDLAPTTGWRTSIDGWAEALDEIEQRLARAEALGDAATLDQRLAAALGLEASELDTLRHVVVAACDEKLSGAETDDHATRLAEEATALSDDPDVELLAAIVRARALLTSWDAAHERRSG